MKWYLAILLASVTWAGFAQEENSLTVFINEGEERNVDYGVVILDDYYVSMMTNDTIHFKAVVLSYKDVNYKFHVLNPFLLEGEIELHFVVRAEGQCSKCTSVSVTDRLINGSHKDRGIIWLSDKVTDSIAEGHVVNHLTIVCVI